MRAVGSRSLLRTISIAVLGGLVGAIAVSVARSFADRAEPKGRVPATLEPLVERPPGSPPQGVQGAAGPTSDPGDVAALRKRVARLESQLAAVADAASGGAQAVGAEGGRGASLALDEARLAQVLADYDRENVDPAWARQAQRGFSDTLQAATETRNFEVASLDCHATICVARLEWPSYGAAISGAESVLHLHYPLGCDRDAFTLPPDDPSSRYEMELVFRCP